MTFQCKLVTSLEKYSVDNTIVELKNNVDRPQLNNIVAQILKQLDKVGDQEDLTFDFLVYGRILRLSVEEHLRLYSDEIEAEEVLSEKLVEIEYVVSLEAPKPLEAIPHEDWVSCIDANESYLLSGSYDNSIRIFSVKERKTIVTIANAHEKPVSKVRWLTTTLSIDSKPNKNNLYFVSCGHDEVTILRKFNTKTCKTEVVFTFKGHNRSVNCLDTFDDVLATGSFDKTLRIWSTNLIEDEQSGDHDENGQTNSSKKRKVKSSDKSVDNSKLTRRAVMTLTGHQESITGVKFLGKCNEFNSLASCSMDRSICIWDIEVGESKRKLLSSKPMLGLDYNSQTNLIIGASCDRYVRLWDSREPDNAPAKSVYISHTAWVSSVAFGENPNNFISGGYDNLVKLWDIRSPKACMFDMIGHHDKVLDVNWSNPAFVFSGSADSTLKVFGTK